MRNKSLVIGFTIFIALFCLYFLSFTPLSKKVEREAEQQAIQNGAVNLQKKQAYLDSIYTLPAANVLGIEYTYQELKQNELKLGLDLQGGMHITLQVSPKEIIKALAANSNREEFNKALANASILQKQSKESYVNLFYQEYLKLKPEGGLALVFSNNQTQGRINQKSTDKEVLALINEEVSQAIHRSFNILRTRIDRFGTTQPNIQLIPGTERIQIEMPGVDNPERVRKLLQGVAKLEFWEVYSIDEISPLLESSNKHWMAQHQSPANVDQDLEISQLGDSSSSESLEAQLQQESSDSTLAPDNVSPLIGKIRSQYGLIYEVSDTALINQQIQETQNAKLFPSTIKFAWALKPDASQEGGKQYIELFALKAGRDGKAALGGEAVSDATPSLDQGSPGVSMRMNVEGTKKWRKITMENLGKQIAIVLDNQVYSAPVVQTEIPNGSSSISGNFTIDESKDLANILKAGKMPVSTKIVEEAVVGPSLGQEAIMQGLLSMAAGLGLVVLFMVVYYHSSGMVANIALMANIFFVIGLLAQFSASLTLPGIAGIVLTIGMSVDANVLIFERIREELRNGRGLMDSIKLGYDKAYSSIIDSNVTTFLTGAILYMFGSGGVKGFAVVLMIGIASSLFTAVFITRLIIEWMASRKNAGYLRFDTAFSKSLLSNIQFDFIGFRKKAYVLSAVIIAIGFAAIAYKGGLSLGVDFNGGRSYVVRFDEAISASDARQAIVPYLEGAGVEVKTYGGENQLKITTSYLIGDDSDEADKKVEKSIKEGLKQFDTQKPKVMSTSKVGATMADDIRSSSQTSIIYSLIVIFIYIVIRFRKWQYGLGAIIALFHDVLMVIAWFGIAKVFGLNLEVDQVFIAAILTVIGYSINDTVVVFDRIREFAKEGSADAFHKTFNKSINETLSRTLITSFTVFIVVAVLLLFGGEVLRGFSFALLIGVIFGTYSSVFIASPIVLDLARKDKKGIAKSAESHKQVQKA